MVLVLYANLFFVVLLVPATIAADIAELILSIKCESISNLQIILSVVEIVFWVVLEIVYIVRVIGYFDSNIIFSINSSTNVVNIK